MAELNTPLILGDLHLKNRVVMAPLTRSRATIDRVPTPMMAEYYAQRASAGLIISEATVISEAANGYLQTPGLFTDAQVQGWKLVTQAVHEQQGLIVAQLWHVGRVSHPDLLDGDTPVSASAVQQAGYVSLLRPKREYVVPRPLEIAEIKSIVEQYKQSAIKAKEAGFDGVELHAANGYLIDQFLQSKTNLREDEYGGSVKTAHVYCLKWWMR
jgi:NADH:flavin oxidoreductases, Old Yellow Enzyme family